MKEKEINVVLQNKFAKITKVAPQDVDNKKANPSNNYNILFAVKPFYMILHLIGLQKVSFVNNDVTLTSILPKLYSFIVVLAILGIQTFVISQKFLSFYSATNPADTVIDLLSLIPTTLASVISLIMSATCNQRMILRTLNNFQIIDKQLSIQSNNIYMPLRIKTVSIMACIIIGTMAQYLYDYYMMQGELEISAMPIVSIIKELNLLELSLMIYIVTIRLDVLNEQLESTKYDVSKLFKAEMVTNCKRTDAILMKVSDKLGFAEKPEHKIGDGEEQVDDLTRLMRIFDRLADNANIVNSCFGIPLLCAAIAVFVNILSTVSDLIVRWSKETVEDTELVTGSIVGWCLRDLVFVAMVTICCETLQSRVKKTSNIVNKLSISSKMDPRRQELLERFSQLMSCRRFTITACNFFPFDFTFVYSLVGAVATYTVIILQVNQSTSKPKTTDATTTIPTTTQ